MENFEKILKRELGTLKDEFGNEIKGLRSEVKDEINGLRTEIKDEINDLRTEMGNKFEDFKDEIRERFFVFEHDYGKEIDAIYDKVVLNEELTKLQLSEIKKDVGKNEMRLLDNSIQISSIKNQNTNSKV